MSEILLYIGYCLLTCTYKYERFYMLNIHGLRNPQASCDVNNCNTDMADTIIKKKMVQLWMCYWKMWSLISFVSISISRISVGINICNCVWYNCWLGSPSSWSGLEARKWTEERLVLFDVVQSCKKWLLLLVNACYCYLRVGKGKGILSITNSKLCGGTVKCVSLCCRSHHFLCLGRNTELVGGRNKQWTSCVLGPKVHAAYLHYHPSKR